MHSDYVLKLPGSQVIKDICPRIGFYTIIFYSWMKEFTKE